MIIFYIGIEPVHTVNIGWCICPEKGHRCFTSRMTIYDCFHRMLSLHVEYDVRLMEYQLYSLILLNPLLRLVLRCERDEVLHGCVYTMGLRGGGDEIQANACGICSFRSQIEAILSLFFFDYLGNEGSYLVQLQRPINPLLSWL